jgi:hypothetical protein
LCPADAEPNLAVQDGRPESWSSRFPAQPENTLKDPRPVTITAWDDRGVTRRVPALFAAGIVVASVVLRALRDRTF